MVRRQYPPATLLLSERYVTARISDASRGQDMTSFTLGRSQPIGGVVAAWCIGILAIFGYALTRETVVVTHWANGHMTSDMLLPAFAREFNAAGHTTPSGKRIEVRPIEV